MQYFNIIGMFTLRFLSLDSAGLLDNYLRIDFLEFNFLDDFRWTLFDFFDRKIISSSANQPDGGSVSILVSKLSHFTVID